MEKRGRRRRNIPDMIIPLSTVEKRLDSYRDKREMVQDIGSMAFTLTTTQIPNESCILVLS